MHLGMIKTYQKYYAVLCNTLQYGVVLCTTLFESSSKKGRVRNRMGSANRMDNVQQVAINSCRHIVLVYLYLYLLKPPAPCGTDGKFL